MLKTFTVLKHLSFYFLTALLFQLISTQALHATHAMGSDLTIRCLSGNTYEITLTIYRDCIGSRLNDKQNIEFSSDSCGVARFIQKADRVSITELSPLCPAQQPNSTCNGGPFPGVEEHVYKLTITLPQNCPDWKIAWHLCCRNYAITNSVITPQTRMYIESFLNNRDVVCNNSPTFTTFPVPYLCNGQPFIFNNGAIDPDGDSLAFELVNPRDFVSGSSVFIPYVAGFSQNYPMATSPPGSFNFDPSSGQFDFTPNGLQQGIVTLLVKEYRNGMLIGSMMRDIQMVVINCANLSPNLSPPFNVTGGQLNGNTFSVCAGNTLTFDITATDPNASDILTMLTTLATAIPGATFTVSGTNPVTGQFSWPTTVADIGNYFFSIEVEDDGCPITARQVKGFNVIVQTGEVLPPNVIQICPTTTSTVQLTATTPNTGGTFSWDPTGGLSNPNISNPIATVDSGLNYTVTYIEPGGCPIVEPFQIVPEATLTLTGDTFRVCQGGNVQLGVTFTINGPPVPFTYTWDPPTGLNNPTVANPVATPTATTQYSVTVSTLTCDFTADVLVIVDDPPSLDPFTDVEICTGDSVQLSASGTNLADAVYSWSPVLGLSDPTIPNPMASPTSTTVYTLTATNSCGSSSEPVTVTVFPPMTVSSAITDVSCNGGSDGEITAVTFGGAGSPVYTWTPNVGSGATVSNLTPGTYIVSVTDAANCAANDTVVISEPTPIVIDSTSNINVDCFGGTNGSITVFASGGTPGYRYSIDGSTFLTINTFSNLTAGTYTITVMDANDCMATSPPITLTEPLIPVLAAVSNKVNADCNNAVGTATITASGGTPPYQFSIDGVNFSPSGSFSGLSPGTYIFSVRDTVGCIDTIAVNISQVADPYAQIDSIRDVSCFGATDGYVNLNGFSGTPPYLYSFNGGPFTPTDSFLNLVAGSYTVVLMDSIGCTYDVNFTIDQPDSLYAFIGSLDTIDCFGNNIGSVLALGSGGLPPYQYSLNGGPFSAMNLFENLVAGTYTITVTDSNLCPTDLTVDIPEPAPLQALVNDQRDISCFGEYTGEVTLGAAGGTLPYRYSIDGTNFFASSVFPNLNAGTYMFYIKDANDCLDSISATIIQPPPLSIDIASTIDAICFGTPTGRITVSGSGGTTPYQFSIDNGTTFFTNPQIDNLYAGTYVIIIRDDNGCLAEVDTVLMEPDDLVGDIDKMDVTCFGDSNGFALANVRGGISPYSYEWSNGATTSLANNLGPGNYIATITDGNNCQISLTTEIFEPPLFEFDTTRFTDVTCFEGSDGTAAVEVSGGSEPYTYLWTNGETTDSVSNLSAGMHIITATDSNNCMIMDTVMINQPDEIIIEVVDKEDSFCEEPNGHITVIASGGVPAYTYSWNTTPPQEGVMASDLLGEPLGGPYTVTVTDSNGCQAMLTESIGSSLLPIAAFVTSLAQDTSIIPIEGVQFTNQSQNAIAYEWDFGDGTQSNEENPMKIYRDEGTYQVRLVAFDPNFLCPDTAYYSFTLIPPGAIYVANAFTPNGDGINDNFFPVGIGVVEVEMNIWDRWGVHLTTLHSMEERWDGTKNGNPVQEGVYVFVINATLNDGRQFFKVGTVTLIR